MPDKQIAFQIGQANMVRPSVAADLNMMRAPIIRTVNQEPANAGRPHFAKGDFLLALGHRGGLLQSSSRSLRTASLKGFLDFSQTLDGPLR
jgi:hypothetical protein